MCASILSLIRKVASVPFCDRDQTDISTDLAEARKNGRFTTIPVRDFRGWLARSLGIPKLLP